MLWDVLVSGCLRDPITMLLLLLQSMYNDGPRVNWGGHILGVKSQAKLRKREKALAKELSTRP